MWFKLEQIWVDLFKNKLEQAYRQRYKEVTRASVPCTLAVRSNVASVRGAMSGFVGTQAAAKARQVPAGRSSLHWTVDRHSWSGNVIFDPKPNVGPQSNPVCANPNRCVHALIGEHVAPLCCVVCCACFHVWLVRRCPWQELLPCELGLPRWIVHVV